MRIYALATAVVIAGCSPGPAPEPVAETPGAVLLNQAPYNDVLPGGGGTGTVDFHGRIRHFAIGGLGVAGSAIAIIQTSGEVYRLNSVAAFGGTYRRAASMPVIRGQASGGLWLQNENGAIVHLADPPGGRMPDIGSDAVSIVLND